MISSMFRVFILVSLGYVLQVSCKTHYFEDLCELPSLFKIESSRFSLGKSSSNRRFGSTVEVKSGETIIALLGSDLNIKSKLKINQEQQFIKQTLLNDTKNETNNKNENSTYDCSFGIKSSKNLTFTIHWHGFTNNCNSYLQIFQEANKIMLPLFQKGNYVFNSTRLIPINLRVSMCENKNNGLIIVVTTIGETSRALLSSFLKTFTSFFAPFFGFSFVAILIGCCLVNRSRWFSSNRSNNVQVRVDKPPKYDELFPKNVKIETFPPSYEECTKPKN